MKAQQIVLEILKTMYSFVMAGFVFLFFCLLLDVFGWAVAGGWNPLLGSWPIFSGTVAAVVYGSWGTVLCLGVGVALIARIILWDRTPLLIEIWMQPGE